MTREPDGVASGCGADAKSGADRLELTRRAAFSDSPLCPPRVPPPTPTRQGTLIFFACFTFPARNRDAALHAPPCPATHRSLARRIPGRRQRLQAPRLGRKSIRGCRVRRRPRSGQAGRGEVGRRRSHRGRVGTAPRRRLAGRGHLHRLRRRSHPRAGRVPFAERQAVRPAAGEEGHEGPRHVARLEQAFRVQAHARVRGPRGRDRVPRAREPDQPALLQEDRGGQGELRPLRAGVPEGRGQPRRVGQDRRQRRRASEGLAGLEGQGPAPGQVVGRDRNRTVPDRPPLRRHGLRPGLPRDQHRPPPACARQHGDRVDAGHQA